MLHLGGAGARPAQLVGRFYDRLEIVGARTGGGLEKGRVVDLVHLGQLEGGELQVTVRAVQFVKDRGLPSEQDCHHIVWLIFGYY